MTVGEWRFRDGRVLRSSASLSPATEFVIPVIITVACASFGATIRHYSWLGTTHAEYDCLSMPACGLRSFSPMTLTKIAPQNLRTPGPTPIPDDIVEEMSLPMINHRGPEFKEADRGHDRRVEAGLYDHRRPVHPHRQRHWRAGGRRGQHALARRQGYRLHRRRIRRPLRSRLPRPMAPTFCGWISSGATPSTLTRFAPNCKRTRPSKPCWSRTTKPPPA